MRKFILAFCGLMVASTASAFDLDLGISEHSLDIGTSIELSSNSKMGGSFLYHEKNGRMANWGVFATGIAGGFHTAFGVKAFALDHKDLDYVSWGFAPGASVGLDLTRSMRVEAEYFYAPSILTFNRAENVNQFDSRFVLSPMANADIFFGYRRIDFRTRDDGRNTIHNGGYIGMKLSL